MWAYQNDAIIAVLDAVKAVCGVVAANDPRAAGQLSDAFHSMAKQYMEKHNSDGAVMMAQLLDHLAAQQGAQRMKDIPPQGTA